MDIRILIADDHRLVREGVRAMLITQPDFAVVGEASSGSEAVRLAQELDSDVVLMDVNTPPLSGIEAASRIRAKSARPRVLMLSMYSDPTVVREAIMAGASGFLTKNCDSAELVRAIRCVASGNVFRNDLYETALGEEPPGVLTPREREVVKYVAEGLSTREIAKKLHISIKTVESHRTNIMTKFDTRSVAVLTRFAIRTGLTSL